MLCLALFVRDRCLFLVKHGVCFVKQTSVMKCQTCTYVVKGFQTYICIGQTEGSLVQQIWIKLVLSSYQGKEMVFEQTDICLKHLKVVFVFSSKTIHHVCLTKQGLCIVKQRFCIFQTEGHSFKERPLSLSNRASL